MKNDFSKADLCHKFDHSDHLAYKHIEYELIRSDRRTVAICVSDGKVVVRAPRSCSLNKIENFLEQKSTWISEKLSVGAMRDNEFSDLISFEKILIFGEKYDLILGERSRLTDKVLYLSDLKDLRNFVISFFGDKFRAIVKEVSDLCGLYPTNICFRSYVARWGCCDAKGNITFNYKLMMLAEDIQEYVVLHELCHIAHMNHSADFWILVEKYMPDYKSKRATLHKFDFLTRLYP